MYLYPGASNRTHPLTGTLILGYNSSLHVFIMSAIAWNKGKKINDILYVLSRFNSTSSLSVDQEDKSERYDGGLNKPSTSSPPLCDSGNELNASLCKAPCCISISEY